MRRALTDDELTVCADPDLALDVAFGRVFATPAGAELLAVMDLLHKASIGREEIERRVQAMRQRWATKAP